MIGYSSLAINTVSVKLTYVTIYPLVIDKKYDSIKR